MPVKEKPVPFLVRLYKKQNRKLDKLARGGDRAEIIRRAIDAY